MKDHWSQLARRARAQARPDEEMPFGFEAAVLRRLAAAGRESAIESWLPVIRPALGMAFATALLCVALQFRAEKEAPSNLLVETDNLIQLAVLK
jgi:hypothetical protein